MIIAVNKWDAIEKDTNTSNKFSKKIRGDPFLYALCGYYLYIGSDRTAASEIIRSY